MESEHDRPATFFRFEDLRVYHKALEYVEWVSMMARKTTDDPVWRIFADRFLSSTIGIPQNIAEGSSRNKSQFVYYLKMAKSSVRECVVLSTIARTHGLLNDDEYDESKNRLMEMTKMIGALIGSLQRSIKPGELDDEDNLD